MKNIKKKVDGKNLLFINRQFEGVIDDNSLKKFINIKGSKLTIRIGDYTPIIEWKKY